MTRFTASGDSVLLTFHARHGASSQSESHVPPCSPVRLEARSSLKPASVAAPLPSQPVPSRFERLGPPRDSSREPNRLHFLRGTMANELTDATSCAVCRAKHDIMKRCTRCKSVFYVRPFELCKPYHASAIAETLQTLLREKSKRLC